MADLSALLGRTLVLVAHPDDEAAGCGVLLQRMREAAVVFATDGAPRDDYFWKHHGSRLRYSRVRQEEARNALAAVGVSEVEFLHHFTNLSSRREPIATDPLEQFVDQELHRNIPQAFERLVEIVQRRRPEALLTLAYEGGHPDHDTCSFLGSLLGRQFGLPTWEMPLYFRAQPGDRIFQDFYQKNGTEVELEPTASEIEAKRRMLASYRSQSHFLTRFAEHKEHFRPQAAYDYTRPPHEGLLNYEAWQWPITGKQVAESFTSYLHNAKISTRITGSPPAGSSASR
jgi:LmbE family N-acetylglucosaminyl deacetylase